MGWFSRRRKRDEPSEDLQEAFNGLKKDFRALQMEWDITYDKIRSLMGRISKRAAIIQEDTANSDQEERQVPSSNVPPGTESWTPSMHRAQAQILARRARGIPNS